MTCPFPLSLTETNEQEIRRIVTEYLDELSERNFLPTFEVETNVELGTVTLTFYVGGDNG